MAVRQHPQLRHLDTRRISLGDLCARPVRRRAMILALVLFLPLAGFLLAALAPRDSKAPLYIAFAASLGAFLASLGLIAPAIDRGASFTSIVDLPWIEGAGFQIRFHLG